MKSFSLFISIMATTLASASHADAANCTTKHSEAWCILDFSDFSDGAREVTTAKATAYLEKFESKTAEPGASIDKGHLVVASLDAAKLTTPVPGLSRGFSLGMGLLMAFTSDWKAGEHLQMFMVMPESVAKDGDPNAIAEKILVEAIEKYLGATDFKMEEVESKSTIGIKSVSRHYLMTGGARCGDIGCEYASPLFRRDRPKLVEKAPDWVGDSNAYVWSKFHASVRPYVHMANEPKKNQIFSTADLPEIIKLLPPWFYLYVPGEVAFVINSEQARPLAR